MLADHLMNVEAILITAIAASWGVVGTVCNILWERSKQCEKDRVDMRRELEEMKAATGLAKGTLISFERCPLGTCPFKNAHLVQNPQP